MKQLFLVLALSLVACKKEDPQPTPTPTPQPTGTLSTFQLDCNTGFEASFNWDSDPEIDTTIVSQVAKNIVWKKRMFQNSFIMTGKSYRHLPDTTKLLIKVSVGSTDVVNSKDTTFTARTFTIQ